MRFLAFPALILTLALGSASAQIYADFETSLGNFTCELNYTAAPKTVANFISLAEGTRVWADPSTGTLRENTPFYDGLIFHRVIAGFMNQSGCSMGTGSGGPGYQFPDENNGLVHVPYVISMANSGANTNGSQFFVTVPRPSPLNFEHLDGVHTIFGTVTAGRDIVDQINAVPVSSSTAKPVTPVVINRVVIRKIGTAANAFTIPAQALPVVSQARFEIEVDPALQFAKGIPLSLPSGGRVTYTYRSNDLNGWELRMRSYHGLGNQSTEPFLIDEVVGLAQTIGSRGFYRFTQAEHADAFAPASLAGKTLRVDWSNQHVIFTIGGTGTTGSMYYSNDGITRDVTWVYPPTGPYDMIFDVPPFGTLKVSSALSSETPTSLIGTHRIQQWNNVAGSWMTLGKGQATLSK